MQIVFGDQFSLELHALWDNKLPETKNCVEFYNKRSAVQFRAI